MEKSDWFEPDWPAPTRVRALLTTRRGGLSKGIFASMNLGANSGDESASAYRAILRGVLPDEPAWLSQVHGDKVVEAAHVLETTEADASFTRTSGIVCAVLSAD
jgi:copper oxidase (laccase) domain-containing protein